MSSIFNSTFSRSLSRFFPAAPQKGMPCSSSFFPGASPTNSMSAFGLPLPTTIFVASLNSWVCFTSAASRKKNSGDFLFESMREKRI